MNAKMNELKACNKAKAHSIKELRKEIKKLQRSNKYAGDIQYLLLIQKRDYRHHHIAYCELRGRTRDEIEPVTKSDNLPNESTIQTIKDTYYYEDVCTSAA